MKVEVKTDVKLMPEEATAIKKARDILCDFEMNSTYEEKMALENLFATDINFNNGVLPTTTDFLTFLVRVSGNEEEEY